MTPTNDDQNAALAQALTRFVDERLQGKQPDADEFAAQYPECEARLKERLQDLEEIDSLFDSLLRAGEEEFTCTTAEPDLVGRRIGNFEVKKMIGRGGMGVVYLARDVRLDRDVAVKSMPPGMADDSTARVHLHREARLLASVNHPNIAVIHDITEQREGTGYLILEYVPGQTLGEQIARGPLGIEAALSIAQQIAEAVAAAHAKGVVHRDLKPGNIKITPNGQVKVLDFGLAKAAINKGTRIEDAVTEAGRIVGTPAYMSPEQARGDPTDHRTDIWSFGCIVYQMLTGHSPFESDTVTDTLTRVIERHPDWGRLPEETPERVRVLLGRCLEKDPERRLAGISEAAVEIREALKAATSETAAPGRSRWRWALATGLVLGAIVLGLNVSRREQSPGGRDRVEALAVLPFRNLTGDPDGEHVARGLTEALIADLGKIEALQVRSHTVTMPYKDANTPLPEIARELDADYVIDGSIRRAGQRVQFTVRLMDPKLERQLWADDYDRNLADIMILSSEVTRAVAREIEVPIAPQEQARLASARRVNPEAHDLYLRGKYQSVGMNKNDLEKAVEYFQEAIEVDPNYAEAYVGLASAYGHLWWLGHLPLDEVKSRNSVLLETALEIDDTLPEAHVTLSEARWYAYWDWEGGVYEMERALELNPKHADAHREYAYYLMALGRREESIAQATRALELEPFVTLYRTTLAWMYYLGGQYEESIREDLYLAELQPNSYGRYLGMARTYEQMGRYEDAIAARRTAAGLSEDAPEKMEALIRAYRKDGPEGYWRWNLEQLEGKYEDNPYHTATLYARLGNRDEAITWLEKAYAQHHGGMYLLKVDPAFDRLRNAPRFQDLLRRMNFPEQTPRN